jgi:hypothetical protein
MANNGRALSILLAAGLVLSAVYILNWYAGSQSATGAFVSGPGAASPFLAALVLVLAATTLWHIKYRPI